MNTYRSPKWLGKSSAQPRSVNAPEVVLLAIDECHRHLLGEPSDKLSIAVDLDPQPRVTTLSANLGNRRLRDVAQVTVDA